MLSSLRSTLRHLYDPAALRHSPLFERLITAEHAGPLALQELLIAEIEALKPETHLSPQADGWRIYRILSHRFVEQFTQQEVAANLGLSIRQLRREEQRALRALSTTLMRRYPEQLAGLSQEADEEGEAGDADEAEPPVASEAQEMAWLERSLASTPTDAAALVQSVLATTLPLLETLGVRAQVEAAPELPRALIQPTTVRQALLSLIAAAARAIPGGAIHVTVEGGAAAVEIALQSVAASGACELAAFDEAITIARQLLALSEGTLDSVTPGQPDCALLLRLRLPVARAVTVLVVDDNADTLQLYERYLAESAYRFAGLRAPGEAVALAEQSAPAAIVLDVMLPEIDGWELLGRLREAPATRAIPVIVSTILPQEAFALTLGAAAFLRKPFTRAQLVEVLDRVTREAR